MGTIFLLNTTTDSIITRVYSDSFYFDGLSLPVNPNQNKTGTIHKKLNSYINFTVKTEVPVRVEISSTDKKYVWYVEFCESGTKRVQLPIIWDKDKDIEITLIDGGCDVLSCPVPNPNVECIHPLEFAMNQALDIYLNSKSNPFESIFLFNILDVMDNNPSETLSGATKQIILDGVVINDNTRNDCSSCSESENVKIYMIGGMESFLKFAEYKKYTLPDKQTIPCCGNLQASTEMSNMYTSEMGTNTLTPCSTNFNACVDSLRQFLVPVNFSDILSEKGIVEFSSYDSGSNVCVFKNFLEENSNSDSEKEKTLQILLLEGLIIYCSESTIFIGGVDAFINWIG